MIVTTATYPYLYLSNAGEAAQHEPHWPDLVGYNSLGWQLQAYKYRQLVRRRCNMCMCVIHDILHRSIVELRVRPLWPLLQVDWSVMGAARCYEGWHWLWRVHIVHISSQSFMHRWTRCLHSVQNVGKCSPEEHADLKLKGCQCDALNPVQIIQSPCQRCWTSDSRLRPQAHCRSKGAFLAGAPL